MQSYFHGCRTENIKKQDSQTTHPLQTNATPGNMGLGEGVVFAILRVFCV